MKKIIKNGLLMSGLVVALLFTNKAEAQLLPEFGIKGGLNLSTISNADGSESKAGILAGAFVKLNVPASPIAIQPELLYVQYGANDESSDAQVILNYIQVPVLLSFGFDVPASPVAPNVFFGPYVGFNTKAENDDGDGNTADLDDFIKGTDYGVVVGAGLDVSKFRIGLRYTAGLTNIFEDDFEDGEKNGGIALTVGVGF